MHVVFHASFEAGKGTVIDTIAIDATQAAAVVNLVMRSSLLVVFGLGVRTVLPCAEAQNVTQRVQRLSANANANPHDRCSPVDCLFVSAQWEKKFTQCGNEQTFMWA